MKAVKMFLFLLMFSLAVPIVSAELELYHFSNSRYNLGDGVLFSGMVARDSGETFDLNIILKCNNAEEQVGVEVLDLRDIKPKEFSRFVTLPSSLLGKCVVKLNLFNKNGALVETKIFEGFELTNELFGNFEISKSNFQLGDSLSINGLISKVNGDVVDGTAVIYFKRGNVNMFLDTEEVVDGSLDYSKELTRLPAGEYKINIVVSDNFGNNHRFNDFFTIAITNNLDISVNLDKTGYDPGDQMVLSGHIVSGLTLSNLLLKFTFETGDVDKKLSSSSDLFSINYLIPDKVKTGKHTVNITASDDKGNYGFKVVEYNVNARPTLLKLKLDDSSYLPGSVVSFSTSLLDQAGDEIGQGISVYLLDLDGKSVSNKIVSSGASSNILLPGDAKPGLWKLRTEGLGLSDEASFNVKEHQSLDVNLDGSSLVVSNKGNVPFKGPFDVEAGDLKSFTNLKLKLGETKNIDLKKLFPPGSYEVRVPSLEKAFDNVVIPKKKSFFNFGGITGDAIKNVGDSPLRVGTLFISLALICGVLLFLFLGKKRGGNVFRDKAYNKKDGSFGKSASLSSDKDYLLGRKKLEELKAKGIRKDRPVEYGKATQEDVDYWKKKVQQTFEEQERNKTKNEFLRFQEKSMEENKPKKGLFNMFS